MSRKTRAIRLTRQRYANGLLIPASGIASLIRRLNVDCERRVNAAIRSLKMTRIIIAHRPDTIASADRVLRLEGGKLVRTE